MLSASTFRRSAGILSRGDRIFVHPVFRATTGLSLTGSPVLVLNSSASDAELGDAVADALARNKVNVPPPASPEQEKALLSPILQAAGLKSWTAFSKGALSLWVEHDDELTVLPLKKTSSRGAYLGEADSELRVPLPASSAQIGAAVREALTRCST